MFDRGGARRAGASRPQSGSRPSATGCRAWYTIRAPNGDQPLCNGLADVAHPDDPDRRVREVVDSGAR